MKRNITRNWTRGILGAGGFALAIAVNMFAAPTDHVASNAAANTEIQDSPPAAPAGQLSETPPAIPALTPPPLDVSPGMEDIFRMARSGVSEEVLSAYVTKSGKAYQPTPEEIIYLKDLGVAPKTIASIIETGTGNTEVNSSVAKRDFSYDEAQAAATSAEVLVDETDGKTTVNVTTHNHYAAAPQQLGANTPASAPPPDNEAGEEVNAEYFEEALSPYGSWIDVQGVGKCWRPTVSVVNSSWRPYYDGGRWIYSDTGWYWLSDYSWGWAPFHYGRWHMSASYGWVWAPGYTWGPAWVSWRRTSTYCGWAPLPAYYGGGVGVGYNYYGSGWGISVGISWGSYNWVPNRYCYGYYPRYYSAPYVAKQEIYNNSTVIKPTIIGDNNTIIINGPNAKVIADASNTEIRRVNVRDVTSLSDSGPKDYIENGGRSLATFRPTMKSTRRDSTTATATAETRRAPGNSTSTALASTTSSTPETTVRRNAQPTTSESTTPPVATRATATTQSSASRQTTTRPSSAQSESSRATSTARASTSSTTTRLAGQNTTIQKNPNYTTPATQSTPILRNGRTIQYSTPVRHTSPVVAGGITTESRRPNSSYTYPGSSAVYSTTRQTVRTPTVSRSTASSIQTYSPTRRPSSSYSSPSQLETTRSSRPSASASTQAYSTSRQTTSGYSNPARTGTSRSVRSSSAPTSSRVVIPSSRPSTRSIQPSTQSYSRPSTPSPRSSYQSAPTRTPSTRSYSQPATSRSVRTPAARPSTSSSTSRAPTRR